MANYSDIKGFTVQTVSNDPAASIADSGSWSSASSLNTARYQLGGAGTKDLAIGIDGYTTTNVNNVETWDGSAWTEVTETNVTTRDRAAFGVYNAAIAAGGNGPVANVESWNGSAWTEVNDLNTSRSGGRGVGTNTAGLVFGGYTTTNVAVNESWNGTSFTEVNDMNVARNTPGGAGTQTAALAANGGPNANIGANSKTTESWDGTNWTSLSSSSNTNIEAEGLGSAGTQTSALLYGGSIYDSSGPNARTESWNGSAWTELADLGTGRSTGGSAGTDNTSAMYFGGQSPTTGSTEQWTTAFTPTTFAKITQGQLYFNSTTNTFKETISDVPAGIWSSGGNINTARKASAGAGELTTTLIFGGTLNPPTTLGETELYNGSSWTEVADLSTDRAYHGGCGTSTAALATGGSTTGDSPITPSALNEKWDGSSWTEVGDINTARVFCPMFGGPGTTTAAILADGYTPSPPNNNNADAIESWNGSSWSEVAELNSPRRAMGSFGTTTAAIIAGGYVASPNGNVEEWDGSSFTEVADLNTARIPYGNGFGVSTLGVVAGGASGPSYLANTELWNGSSWTEVNDMATGRSETGNSNSSSAVSGLVAGGREASPGAGINSTEEWNAPLANKTITAS